MIIGGLVARMERVEADVKEIRKSQAEMLQILHSAQGGWKMMVAVGSVTAGIGGMAASFIPWGSIFRIFK